MIVLGQQKLDLGSLVLVAAATAGLAAVSVAAPVLMPWSFLALAVLPLLLLWAIRGEVTAWTWVWVFSYGLLDWPSWRITLPGFFNLTVPRILFLLAVLVFLVHLLARPGHVRPRGAVFWVPLALLVWCAASATATGWKLNIDHPEIRGAPYYRFLGSLLFPYVMFLLIYGATRSKRQIVWAAAAFVIYGWYALYLSYLQYAANGGAYHLRAWIWPAYINDPKYGIHFDRSRGAFMGAGPQAVLLVVLFYLDLYLARTWRGGLRVLVLLQALLVVPAIFFTGMRSGYLAFLLCGVVWLLWSGRRWLGGIKLGFAALAAVVGAMLFWSTLTQSERRAGGVAQGRPVVARLILLEQTWEIYRAHPITGVGFGHFVDAQMRLQRDPNSLIGMTYGVLVNHNLFLNMLAETGPVGMLLSLAIFVLLFRESLRLYRKLPDEPNGLVSRTLVALFWVVLINYLTDATFRDPLWDVFSNAMFWSLAGLIVGYNRLLDKPGAAEELGVFAPEAA